jgi:hypothetical protein
MSPLYTVHALYFSFVDYTHFLSKLYKKSTKTISDFGKLHNEELHNLYSSPSIIRMIKSRRMRWAGHVARMGETRGFHIGYCWESQKKRDHWKTKT